MKMMQSIVTEYKNNILNYFDRSYFVRYTRSAYILNRVKTTKIDYRQITLVRNEYGTIALFSFSVSRLVGTEN